MANKINSIINFQLSIFKKYYLFIIVLLALFLRVYKVDRIPPSLYWDEAAMALDAKSISLTGKDHHGNFWLQPIFPSWGDYKLPGYILTAAPFFKLIKNNPELAVRLASALAGTLTVLLVYFLAKEIFKSSVSQYFNISIALIASFLLAVSPWHLQFSRAAFEANLALFFNFLALLFFLKSSKNKKWLLFSVPLAISGIYTYYSTRIVLPLILFLSFLFFWKKSFKNVLSFILFGSLIFLTVLPLRFSSLASQAEQFRLSTKNVLSNPEIIAYSSKLIEQDGNNLLAKKIHHRFLYQAKAMTDHFFKHFSLNFLLLRGDNNLRHSTGRIGELLIVGFIGLVLGEYLLWQKNKKLFSFLNLCLVFSFLPASVPYEVPHALRSLNGVIFLNIIAAFGLVQLIKVLKEKKKSLLLITFYLLLITQLIFYLHDYYVHYPQRSFFSWQGGYKEAVKAVEQEYAKAEKIIFTDAYARPYIYFLLYSNYSLEEFQNQRQEFLSQHPLDYLETKKIDKIEFRMVDLEKDREIEKVLFVTEGFVLWKNY